MTPETPETPETPTPTPATDLEADDLSTVAEPDDGPEEAAEAPPADPEPGAAELVPEPV